MALLAAIVLLAYTAQAVTGFGSTVLSLTLAALFLPIAWVMPIVVALNIPFCAYLVWSERAAIDQRLLAREVLPLMLAGAAVGAAAAPWLGGAWLKHSFGALVLSLAALELWRLSRNREPQPSAPLRAGLTLAAGFTQGLYASGGPLLAAALAGSGMNKGAMRATLSVVWLVLNAALTIWFVIGGRIDGAAARTMLLLLPLTLAGLWLGDRLHDRLDQRQFRAAVNALLLVAGAALVFA
ncbi:MAG TPA: sulfite exporter TauE/SafE family protein [Solimonas sp.]|nr:sulfite exporter TauE/SafE family protein [Solimonas sp.]